ncbi:large ribosomal subunit protein bL17m-like isoform X1 [Mobula hypostoma]|uniref:large ribosomal subunit protein bL17m-like isoform X1 n=1 Tax=Mobula hypostoma TaxID=723540 RepID=UPI002FC28D86
MHLTVTLWIRHGKVYRRMGLGPRSRINMLRCLVTALVRHERIETTLARADEVRVYAERLVDHAKRGETDPRAMEMADFWLTEKDLIPKLFQVLAHRFQNQTGNYVRMLQIPNRDTYDRARMAVIEYRGNPLPPLPTSRPSNNPNTLLNRLLEGWRQEAASTRASAQGQSQVPGAA